MTAARANNLKECYVMFRPAMFRDGVFVRAIIRWERAAEWWMALCCMAREINRKGRIGSREDVVLLHRTEIPDEVIDYFLKAGWLVEEEGILALADPDNWYRARTRDPIIQNENKKIERENKKSGDNSAENTRKNPRGRPRKNGANTEDKIPEVVRSVSAEKNTLSQAKPSQAKPSQAKLSQANPSQAYEKTDTVRTPEKPGKPATTGAAGGGGGVAAGVFFAAGREVYDRLEPGKPFTARHEGQLSQMLGRWPDTPPDVLASALRLAGAEASLKARGSAWGLLLTIFDDHAEQEHQTHIALAIASDCEARLAALADDFDDDTDEEDTNGFDG